MRDIQYILTHLDEYEADRQIPIVASTANDLYVDRIRDSCILDMSYQLKSIAVKWAEIVEAERKKDGDINAT